MTVGERIRERRIELGLSQKELAERMGYSDKTGISKAETCGDNITTTKINRFADALGCTFEYLMGWEEEAPPTKENAIMLANIMKSKVMAEYVQKMMNLSEKKKESLFKYIDFLSSTDD